MAVREAIDEAAKAAGVELIRADDIFAGGVIIDQIESAISRADVIIAVCTGKNPNVFFELGLAEAVGHKPILLAPSAKHLPFDQGHWRCQMYGRGRLDDLAARLERAIKETAAEGRGGGAFNRDATVESEVSFSRAFEAAATDTKSTAYGLIEAASGKELSGYLMGILEPNAFQGAHRLLNVVLPVAQFHPEWLPRSLRTLARSFGEGDSLRDLANQQWSYVFLMGLLCALADREDWRAFGVVLSTSAPPGRVNDDAPLPMNKRFMWPRGYFADASLAVAALDRFLSASDVSELVCDFRKRQELIPATSLLIGLARAVWEERQGRAGRIGAYAAFASYDVWAYSWAVRQLQSSEELARALGAEGCAELSSVAERRYPELRQMSDSTNPWAPSSWEDLLHEASVDR